jgi:hypothetical protein
MRVAARAGMRKAAAAHQQKEIAGSGGSGDRPAQNKVPSSGRWIRPGRCHLSRAPLLRNIRLADLLLIRPHQVAAEHRPRTEARHRRQDHGSEGLTDRGP